jgi:hypothetical protein
VYVRNGHLGQWVRVAHSPNRHSCCSSSTGNFQAGSAMARLPCTYVSSRWFRQGLVRGKGHPTMRQPPSCLTRRVRACVIGGRSDPWWGRGGPGMRVVVPCSGNTPHGRHRLGRLPDVCSRQVCRWGCVGTWCQGSHAPTTWRSAPTAAGYCSANGARARAARRAIAGETWVCHSVTPGVSAGVRRFPCWWMRCPAYSQARSLLSAGSRSTSLYRGPLPRDQIRWSSRPLRPAMAKA